MTDRTNVHRQVRTLLDDDEPTALAILPAYAGELMAAADTIALADLNDALSHRVLHDEPNAAVAAAVLAMLRSFALHRATRHSP